ncbi:transglycosylase SLT domain-containing protein [Alkalimarinus sediminis]|uniref:Transglycosylase SLT domain-containing protein n=1 Tax=Alkalimarinus sediminis TaxID=1632866 RepID=A0A9E8HKE7_9ALTE|nr:transglycosylase SLT domain-containing protein [Alkalimarinus sediminis]UZW74416.1 transglycosylase SLT domain-containing protein [Alkalimarinus sediminis]
MIQYRTLLTIVAILLPFSLAAQLNTTQQTYLAALDALNEGKVDTFKSLSESISDYVLSPYLEYERIRHGKYQDTDGIKAFLEHYPDQSISNRLKYEWLLSLPKRGEWDMFLQHYDETLQSRTLNCYYLRALYRSGEQDKALGLTADAWTISGSAPKACDPLFRIWIKSSYFKPDYAYERVKLALSRGHTSLASYASNFLKGDQHKAAATMIWVHKNPDILASTKLFPTDNPYMKEVVAHGIKRRIRRRPDAALTYWNKHNSRFEFTPAEVVELEKRIYLGLARQYDESASSLLASLPTDESSQVASHSREVLEWQIRVSLRNRDWGSVLKWIRALEKTDGMRQKWHYWKHKAYLALQLDVPRLDQIQFEKLADTRSYYGFLAAEFLNKPLTLTHAPLPIELDAYETFGKVPEIDRAREFLNIGHTHTAKREWQYLARDKENQAGLMLLAKLAYQWGWHNKAITAVIAADHWNDLSIRFPTPHKDAFMRAAKQVNLESSWLFAIARQESAFAENVKSGAGARGLMQLMPATARQTAKKIGLKLSKNSLYDPQSNITLGSTYLAAMYERFNNNRALATAAYNAGPHRVKKWIKSSAALPIEVWVETIPYDETRRYVKNVLAFDAIYQHKLGEGEPQLLRDFEKIFVSETLLSNATKPHELLVAKKTQ